MTDNKRYTESEELVLASALVFQGDKTADEIREGLRPDDFQNAMAREVFKAVCVLQDKGEPLGPAAILTECEKVNPQVTADAIEVLSYEVISAYDIPECIRRVRSASLSRKLSSLLSDGIKSLIAHEEPETVAADLEQRLKAITEAGKSPIVTAMEASVELADHRHSLETGGTAFIPTGYNGLDSVFGGGLIRGGFYIVAARPGVGKTALALGVTDQVANKLGYRVTFISLEMRTVELMARCAAMRSGISSTDLLLRQHLTEEENARLLDAVTVIGSTGPSFNRVNRMTVNEIGFIARRSKAELLIIDYLGLIQGEGRSRYEKVTDISNQLKALALNLNIPILCLAQLNRDAVEDEVPKMSDLRDSGAIEQDADGVLLLYRPAAAGADGSVLLKGYVGKNRHGKAGGTVEFMYSPRFNLLKEVRRSSAPDPVDEF